MAYILVTEFINESSLDKLKKKHSVHYDKELSNDPKNLKRIISDFDAIIVRNKTKVNKELIESAKKLKFIGRLGVGLDNIDTDFCKQKNIHVQPATGMNADSVAEYVITSAMYLIKNMPLFDIETKKGNWPRTKFNSKEISGKNFGVIGFGTIGKKVSALAQKIGLNVSVFDPYVKFNNEKDLNIKVLNLTELYEQSDIISLHLTLTEETKNFINKDSFKMMKKKPIIINASRGSIINENDLIEAYHNNLISGFALDVFENEPINKELTNKISDNFNCILSPHISGVTIESNIRVSEFIVNKLIEFID